MFWIVGLTALSTAGTAFYLRFVVALCKECRLIRTGYWMLVRVHSQPEPSPPPVPELEPRPLARAA